MRLHQILGALAQNSWEDQAISRTLVRIGVTSTNGRTAVIADNGICWVYGHVGQKIAS